MQSPIEKLAKFLRLEASRGFDNRAVFGGLQNMREPWKKEAQENQISQQLTEVVLSRLRDYPKLSPQSRQEVLNGLWNRLCSEYPELKSIMAEVPSFEDRKAKDKEMQESEILEERAEVEADLPSKDEGEKSEEASAQPEGKKPP